MKFDHRAWNNVLIFALLFMSFLFLFISGRMNDNTIDGPTPLLESHQRLYQLSIDGASFQKVGLDWRQSAGRDVASIIITDLIQQWQSLSLLRCDNPLSTVGYSVVLSLVGSSQTITIDVVTVNDDDGLIDKRQSPRIYFTINQNCYQSDNVSLSALIPVELQ